MEILNNLWIALNTENKVLINILSVPLGLIESYVHIFLFTTILGIPANTKKKVIYIVSASVLGVISTFFIPKLYGNILNIICIPLLIMLIFKVNLPKSLLSEFLILFCVTVSELLVTRLFLIVFNCSYTMCANIPIYRLLSTLLIYLFVYIMTKLLKHFHMIIDSWSTLNATNKTLLLSNIIFAIIVIFMQMYLIEYYNDKLPSLIVLINIACLIAYFTLSIYSMIKTMKLVKTTEDLEQEKLYNKTLQILHDNIRAFKHDFSNIISGIGGYVETNDMKGLKKYYKQLLQDCNQVCNLGSLNPEVINSPAIYSVLANKYYKADSLGIKINLDSFIDFNSLHMGVYEFTRILGILMDNAIEASAECDNKLINVTIRNDSKQNRQLLIVENTYNDKNVDTEKIYEKGYSTKKKNTGLGLWEVERIIKKHKNLARFTSKTDNFFTQQLEIYNE